MYKVWSAQYLRSTESEQIVHSYAFYGLVANLGTYVFS